MKRLFSILFFALFVLPVHALTIETATVTVTNTSGTVNGNTISINGSLRTWTNNVTSASAHIAITNTIGAAATNLFNSYSVSTVPFGKITRSGTNAVIFESFPGRPMVISLGGTWGTVSFSTNTLNEKQFITASKSAEGAYAKTNLASSVVEWVDSDESTNTVRATAPSFVNFVNTTESQTISGAKNFTGGFSGTAENITNGIFNSPTFTNGANYGEPFRSPGTAALTEQFGANTQAINEGDNAFGYTAIASGGYALALGLGSIAGGFQSIAIGGGEVYTNSNLAIAMGQGSIAEGFNTLAVGQLSYAGAKNGSAFGSGAHSSHTNSTAIGVGSQTTETNQVFLGQASGTVMIPGGLTVGGVTTNFHMAGTNTLDGSIGITRKNNSSLANGNNAAVSTGTNTFIKLSGPTASFTICGLADAYEGKVVILLNDTTYSFTIAHESGVDPTAANRIRTRTGADVTITSTAGPGAATLIYDSSVSRWILISTN